MEKQTTPNKTNNILSNNLILPDELDLEELFNKFDDDNSGTLDMQELF